MHNDKSLSGLSRGAHLRAHPAATGLGLVYRAKGSGHLHVPTPHNGGA